MQLIWFPKSEVFSIKSNLQQTFKLSLDLSFTKNGSDPAPFSHNAGAESWTEFKFGSEWKTLLIIDERLKQLEIYRIQHTSWLIKQSTNQVYWYKDQKKYSRESFGGRVFWRVKLKTVDIP